MAEHRWLLRLIQHSGAIGLVGLLAACESTFVGNKLADDGSFSATSNENGVPFTLNKAEYSLSRKANASGEPVYTINVAHVPDSSQRYTLKVSSSIFADTNFSADVGPGGVLTSTTGKRTDRVVPSIKAVGSFVGNIIGILGTGVFDKDTRRTYITGLIDDECKNEAFRDPLKRRILKFADDEVFEAQFHYLSQAEKACLETVKKAAEDDIEELSDVRLEDWKKARKTFKTSERALDREDQAFLDRLDKAVAEGDTDVWNAIKDALQKADEGDDEPLRKVLALESVGDPLKPRIEAWGTLHSDAGDKITGSRNEKVVEALKAIVDMTIPMWRARHVNYLEREIERLEFEILRRDNLTAQEIADKDQAIDDLRKELARTIGMSVEFARMEILAGYLNTLPGTPPQAGEVAPFEEYNRARGEFDVLAKRFQDARSSTLSAGKPKEKPKPKIKPFENQPISVKPASFIDEANKNSKTFFSKNPKAPEFVLVLRRLNQ